MSREQTFMRVALSLADDAESQGEVPVGAVIVYQDEIIASAHNQVISRHDPSAHAEILALREAGRVMGNYRLNQCELYVTLEPCCMCAGAMVHARIKRLVYGASDPKAGAAGSVFDLLKGAPLNHRVAFEGGLFADQSRQLLQDFFRQRRNK